MRIKSSVLVAAGSFWTLVVTDHHSVLAFNLFQRPSSRSSSSSSTKPSRDSPNRRRPMIVPPLPPPPANPSPSDLEDDNGLFSFEESNLDIPNPISPGVWNSMTSTVLGVAAKLAPKDTRKSLEPRAARIQVKRLPPTSIKIDLDDVPVVGKALSGTFAKVKESSWKGGEPSVTIGLPKDVIGAAQHASDTGNLQLGLQGLLQTVVDVQLEPNRPGSAPIELKSPLIPKWPFAKKPASPWYKVSNMGNGETYYFNELSGETRLEKPKKI